MNHFFSNYKLHKSFKIPIIPEDQLTIELESHETDTKVKLSHLTIKEINLNHLSIFSKEKIPVSAQFKIHITQKKIFIKKKYIFTGKCINSQIHSFYNDHFSSTLSIEDKDYQSFVTQFIMRFKKKRLMKYLLQSSTESNQNHDEKVPEAINLINGGFIELCQQKDIQSLLKDSKKAMGSSEASIYLINSSKNRLEKKYTSSPSTKNKSHDYREGLLGTVFLTEELINIYKPNGIPSYQTNEVSPTSILAIPIFNNFKKVIGILEFLNKKSKKRFTKEDEIGLTILSSLFSSFYELHKPQSPFLKRPSFNPDLKIESNIFLDKTFQGPFFILNKIKNKKESILINSNCQKMLDLICHEIINKSRFHDYPIYHFKFNRPDINLEVIPSHSILVLEDISKCSKWDQGLILDIVEGKNIKIISTHLGDQINIHQFKFEFINKVAGHHLNFYVNNKKYKTQEILKELSQNCSTRTSYDEKVLHFEKLINEDKPDFFSLDNKKSA